MKKCKIPFYIFILIVLYLSYYLEQYNLSLTKDLDEK